MCLRRRQLRSDACISAAVDNASRAFPSLHNSDKATSVNLFSIQFGTLLALAPREKGEPILE
jgi:hypothetical protein